MKKYFDIKETVDTDTSDPARIIILYHHDISGYILYSGSKNLILKAGLWECSIHPDFFNELIIQFKKEWPAPIITETTSIVTFPNSEIRIPSAIFNEENLRSWVELSHGNDPDLLLISLKNDEKDLVLVNGINYRNHDLLMDTFKDTVFHSLSTSFYQEYTGDDIRIQLLFYGKNIYLALYQQHQLQLVNSFTFQTPEDVLYILLNLCDTYRLSKETLTINPEGFIDPESAVIKLLEQYFLHIQWPDKRTISMPEEIPVQTAQFIERIISCVS